VLQARLLATMGNCCNSKKVYVPRTEIDKRVRLRALRLWAYLCARWLYRCRVCRFGGVRCLTYPQVRVSPQLVHALQVIDEREATQTAGKHGAVSFERVALQFPKVRVRLFHCCCGRLPVHSPI